MGCVEFISQTKTTMLFNLWFWNTRHCGRCYNRVESTGNVHAAAHKPAIKAKLLIHTRFSLLATNWEFVSRQDRPAQEVQCFP